VLSNVDGQWLTRADQVTGDYLAEHLVRPVRLDDCLGR
jgi:hypothetical protein